LRRGLEDGLAVALRRRDGGVLRRALLARARSAVRLVDRGGLRGGRALLLAALASVDRLDDRRLVVGGVAVPLAGEVPVVGGPLAAGAVDRGPGGVLPVPGPHLVGGDVRRHLTGEGGPDVGQTLRDLVQGCACEQQEAEEAEQDEEDGRRP